jgi:hypothetical protein
MSVLGSERKASDRTQVTISESLSGMLSVITGRMSPLSGVTLSAVSMASYGGVTKCSSHGAESRSQLFSKVFFFFFFLSPFSCALGYRTLCSTSRNLHMPPCRGPRLSSFSTPSTFSKVTGPRYTSCIHHILQQNSPCLYGTMGDSRSSRPRNVKTLKTNANKRTVETYVVMTVRVAG